MKIRFLKTATFIFAIGFTLSFFALSGNFFEVLNPSGVALSKPNKLFFVALFLLFMAVVFNILLFAFILKNKKLTTKLFFSIVPLTILFVSCLYFFVVNNNPQSVVFAARESITNGGKNLGWVIFCIVFVYIALLFLIIVAILKPIKKIENAVGILSNGYTKQKIQLSPGKDFVRIEKGLNQINHNFKQNKELFDKLNYEYSKYLPQQFVKHLGKKSVLELSLGCNIQKEITSMFIDIRNSTKTSFTLSLSDNFNFINKYLGIIGPIVREYDGFVDKYLGDGVLAIFTNPDVALNCANKIVKTINQDSKTLGLYDVKIGIGVHTGQVVMGVIGEKKRLSVTVISDSVNTASYLEKLNSKLGSTVIFTKQTLNALSQDNNLNYRYIGNFSLPNSKDNLSVFESLDCYESKLKQQLILNKDKFENAVRCFELGGDNCKKIFKECNLQEFKDKVSKYYLNQFKKS